MATVTLTTESTYEFDVDTFVEEWQDEFQDWLSFNDQGEGYADTETARKDFVEDQIHELGGDDIPWACDVFKEKDDDFTMDVRGIWS